MSTKKPKETGLGSAADIFFRPTGQAASPPAVEPVVEKAGKPRKKRKDATGQLSDYHTDTSTLAVRLPDDQAQQVRDLAAAAGMSVNAWLVQLIEVELSKK